MKLKKLFLLLALITMPLVFFSCGNSDDEPDGGGSSSGSVKITNIVKGSKRSGKYNYKVTIKATGVQASNVALIGVKWGPTSSASKYQATTKNVTSTTRSLDFSANSTVWLQPMLKVSGGEITYGTKKSVKVPK